MNFQEILALSFLGNTLKDYLWALVAFAGILVALRIIKAQIVRHLRKIAAKTKTQLDDLLVRILNNIGWPILYLLFSFKLSLGFLETPSLLDKIIYYAIVVDIIYLAVKTGEHVVDYATERILLKQEKKDQIADKAAIQILNKAVKITLWIIAVLLVLSNFGYNISAFIASLGIGGIAIAFALQNILSDIFASFSIYFDKPFQVGDFIIVGKDLGTVKHIGIKSTRIQTLQGQELVISNKELTSTRVNNYKKMEKRRIDFTFGVTYDTPTKKLKKVPGTVKRIINNIKLAEADRVHFKEFADFSLNFEVVYYIATSDYNQYMDIQQKINLKIKEAFEKEKIEMAYPTQTIFVKK